MDKKTDPASPKLDAIKKTIQDAAETVDEQTLENAADVVEILGWIEGHLAALVIIGRLVAEKLEISPNKLAQEVRKAYASDETTGKPTPVIPIPAVPVPPSEGAGL